LQAFLATHENFRASVSATTRDPRPGEVEGEHYFFMTPEEFERQIAAGAFVEHACVFGRNSYGTPRQAILDRLAAGISVIMDIDVQGGRQLRENLSEAVQVFVVPPSPAELERRLRGRGTEAEQVIQDRLATASSELTVWSEYDYCIVNDELDQSLRELAAIVTAETCRSARRQ
jgi:guanylate kinase